MTPKIDPLTGQPVKVVPVTVAKAEAFWVERSRSNPADFIHYVSGMKPADHHLVWLHAVLTQPNVNIIAPRESAKTTTFTFLLAWMIGKNPFLTHFIGSVTAKQSQDRVDMIRDLILHNPRYRNVFPNVYIDDRRTNNKSEFTVWCDSFDYGKTVLNYGAYRSLVLAKGDPKNPTVFGVGAGSSQIIGRRFSGLCLLDDPHSEANSATEESRDKVDEWFHRTLLPCVREGARTVVISTRWAETDLSGRLQQKLGENGKPVWHTIDIPAINEKGKSYWPEYWPEEKLDRKRAEVGEVMFQLMYMNNPRGLSSGQFTKDMLSQPLPEPLPDLKSVVVSVDLAFTEGTYSDYSVFIAAARDKESPYNLYVLDMWRGKTNFDGAVSQLIAFCDRVFASYGRLDRVLLESQSLSLPSYEEIRRRRPDIPIETVPLRGDKSTRLGAVALKAQRSGVYINTSMKDYPALISELLSFPKGSHDDICDAISLPLQYWGAGENKSGIIQVRSPFFL